MKSCVDHAGDVKKKKLILVAGDVLVNKPQHGLKVDRVFAGVDVIASLAIRPS